MYVCRESRVYVIKTTFPFPVVSEKPEDYRQIPPGAGNNVPHRYRKIKRHPRIVSCGNFSILAADKFLPGFTRREHFLTAFDSRRRLIKRLADMINRDKRSKDGSSRENGALLRAPCRVKVSREFHSRSRNPESSSLSSHRDVLIIDVVGNNNTARESAPFSPRYVRYIQRTLDTR